MKTYIYSLQISLSLIFSCVLFVAGCGGGNNQRPVDIRFDAHVSGDPFNCSSTYEGLGTSRTEATPQDLRFFVHDVRLIDENGEEVSVALQDDGVWQRDGLALLDFENGEGLCAAQGNPETNTVLRGSASGTRYTAISFVIGVPFEMNHIDAQSAEAPQNDTAMWWNWNAGYKFFKADFSTPGMPTGWLVHLGSTGCTGNATGAINECANPNRSVITIDNFDPDSQSIVLELAELFSQSDIDRNTAQTGPGCMSAPTDPECGPLFSKLGVNGEAQSVFYAN